MRTVLIDVDTQHDFCHPDGALFVRGADRLADSFRALVSRAVEKGTMVIGSVDSHAFDAWEFANAPRKGPNGESPNFPPHCVKGTHGWLKVPGTTAPRTRFIPNVRVDERELESLVTAHEPQGLLLEKEVYSLFANPNADAVLEKTLGGAATRFVVFGVATDYCVRAAALGLIEWIAKTQRSGEVWLVEDAVAAVDPHGGERAIAECVARSVRLVTTQQALEAL